MNAFLCMRTMLLFPSDYVEQWGRLYGIGLGPVPVSEALVNNYYSKSTHNADGHEQYPIAQCCAPIQSVNVTEEEFAANKAILAKDDPKYQLRNEIMRARQIEHGKIKSI